jgi:hypothetical protein
MPKRAKKKLEIDYEADLLWYVQKFLRERGMDPVQISFVADARWPFLPVHYGIYVKVSGGYSYCTWAEPDRWVDLFDSVEAWLNRFCAEWEEKNAKGKS